MQTGGPARPTVPSARQMRGSGSHKRRRAPASRGHDQARGLQGSARFVRLEVTAAGFVRETTRYSLSTALVRPTPGGLSPAATTAPSCPRSRWSRRPSASCSAPETRPAWACRTGPGRSSAAHSRAASSLLQASRPPFGNAAARPSTPLGAGPAGSAPWAPLKLRTPAPDSSRRSRRPSLSCSAPRTGIGAAREDRTGAPSAAHSRAVWSGLQVSRRPNWKPPARRGPHRRASRRTGPGAPSWVAHSRAAPQRLQVSRRPSASCQRAND